MKKLLSLLFVLVMLAGCSGQKYDAGEVQIFLPGEYISDEVIRDFEKETNI